MIQAQDDALAVLDSFKETDNERFYHAGWCGVKWWGSPDKGARPIGCGQDRFCPLCGGAAAGKLQRGAQEFFFDEALEAVKPVLAKTKQNLQAAGGMWTTPVHKLLSRHIIDLLDTEPERFQKEANRIRRESFQVAVDAFGVGNIGGNSKFQFYGESNPGEDHVHIHTTVFPVALNGEKALAGGDEDVDISAVPAGLVREIERGVGRGVLTHAQAQTAYRRFLNGQVKARGPVASVHQVNGQPVGRVDDRRPVGRVVEGEPTGGSTYSDYRGPRRYLKDGVKVTPLPRYIVQERLLEARLAWGAIQVRLAIRLGINPEDIGAELVENTDRTRGQRKTVWRLEGDVHWNYWGWPGHATPDKWAAAVSRGRGVVSYAQRWDGADFARGIEADGRTYVYHKPGENGKRQEFRTELTEDQVARFFWRQDKLPENWPKSQWMGCLSSGEVGLWLTELGWAREKIEVEEQADDDSGVLLPVGRTSSGIRFKRMDGENEGEIFLVPYGDSLDLSPVTGEGKSLYSGRTHRWVKQ